jgi:hypothetical protein
MVSEQKSVYKKKAGPLLALPECCGFRDAGRRSRTSDFYSKNLTTFPIHERSIKWD